jgi:hypothetical protein
VIYNDRFIFVHVPKTAGSSVTAALGNKASVATHTPLHEVEKGDRFAFAFVRNPWARMVSLYRFMCQKQWFPRDAFDQDAVRKMGFRNWLLTDNFVMTEDHPGATPMQRRPQVWWTEGCDYVGRVEDMPNSFHEACNLAGIGPVRLPHSNRTSGSDWREEYDGETVEFVAEHFAADIERFGYNLT